MLEWRLGCLVACRVGGLEAWQLGGGLLACTPFWVSSSIFAVWPLVVHAVLGVML